MYTRFIPWVESQSDYRKFNIQCLVFNNDCYPCYILKWQCNSNFEKETAKTSFASLQEICNFSFLLFEVRKMYNFMHLNVHIPDFLTNPLVLWFCSGRCRVYFYRGHFGFADVLAVSKYQIIFFPLSRSFYPFDTMFLNIHETKCQKKKFGCN